MRVSLALNQVKPGYHLLRARWNPGFTWSRSADRDHQAKRVQATQTQKSGEGHVLRRSGAAPKTGAENRCRRPVPETGVGNRG
jgi:hypothetical protein